MLIALLGIDGQSVIRCIAKHSWWFVPIGLNKEEDSNPEFNGGNPAGTQDKKPDSTIDENHWKFFADSGFGNFYPLKHLGDS